MRYTILLLLLHYSGSTFFFGNRRRQIEKQDFAKHVFLIPRRSRSPAQSKWDVHMSKTDWSPLQKLWEDGEFILSRAVTPGGSEPRLLLVPASERPSPATIRQLEYLYSLRQKLDSAWFARPLAIESQDERPALLLEDPGSNPSWTETRAVSRVTADFEEWHRRSVSTGLFACSGPHSPEPQPRQRLRGSCYGRSSLSRAIYSAACAGGRIPSSRTNRRDFGVPRTGTDWPHEPVN